LLIFKCCFNFKIDVFCVIVVVVVLFFHGIISLKIKFLKIVLSLFVAVILDNLELDEDVKKIKQVNKFDHLQ
jgi:hypothetical protein